MPETTPDTQPAGEGTSRRTFIKGTAAVSVTAALASSGIASSAYAQGSDEIKVGVVGCGGRGTGAAQNAVAGSSGIVLWSMGDLFPDRMNGSANSLANSAGEAFQVPEGRRHVGFDAYERVLAEDIDMCIFATPPHFRPMMVKAAVEAGKHVFFEKPVAVDPHGIRLVMEAGDIAKENGLGMVCGTQRRHQHPYVEAMKLIHEGAIGDVVAAQVGWQQGGLWHKGDGNGQWSGMTTQFRNWLYYPWLSGDHIVEQHVHNIDVALWAFQDQAPVKAYGNGGRQQRTGAQWGNGNDHFSLQITMPGRGRVINSHCRQIPGCDNWVGEEIIGTNGYAQLGGRCVLLDNDGEVLHNLTGGRNPYDQEHTDLVQSIRDGEPLNEAHRIAQSTLTSIICREAAYSGKNIDYNWALNESKLRLGPGDAPGCYTEGCTDYDLDLDVATPPVYIPGAYQMP